MLADRGLDDLERGTRALHDLFQVMLERTGALELLAGQDLAPGGVELAGLTGLRTVKDSLIFWGSFMAKDSSQTYPAVLFPIKYIINTSGLSVVSGH